MSQSLRVLVVEDSEDDADLMLRELRRGGYQVDFERVETARTMSAALDRREWDIVISDHVMHGFNGLEALSLFKKKGLDLPFIIVSGMIGEEIAVGAMKSGAHDYIMKDKMARLVPAVERELREAAVRRARREADLALRESEERFRQLAENIDLAFFMFDWAPGGAPGRLLYVSDAYERIWGRSKKTLETEAMSWLNAVHPEDRKHVLNDLPRMERGSFSREFRIIGLDTSIRWIHYRSFPVFNDYGEQYRIACIAEDITRRKQTEEQLAEKTRSLEEMVEKLRAIEEELRESNQAISESNDRLEKRVRERTSDLVAANAELQHEITERICLQKELLEIAEKERRRIGFDLHDDLSQKLMGISFMVKAMERNLANKIPPKSMETRKIQLLINQVINHTHNLAHGFCALDLKGNDLALELKGLAANVKKMFQITCHFRTEGELPELPENVAAQLYKIAQEAANNAIKHGKARNMSISLSSLPGKLVLAIKNSGVPFPETRESGNGMGLRIMNSRASVIGASIQIKSNAGDGTIVACTLPLVNGSGGARTNFGRSEASVLNGKSPDPARVKPRAAANGSFAT